MNSARDHDPDHVAELFASFGPVVVRRMFGGAGIFADGIMFALIDRGVIYLKADQATIPAFEREGLGPFSYATKAGRRSLTSYWRMPDRLYDDPDDLARWAKQAYAAALSPEPAAKRRAEPRRRTLERQSKPAIKRRKKK